MTTVTTLITDAISFIYDWGSYFLKSCKYQLAGDFFELRNPHFIPGELYQRAKDGYGIAYIGPPLLNSWLKLPNIVVLGSYDENALVRLMQLGEDIQDKDPNARAPLDRIQYALGTRTIAQMQDEEAAAERQKILLFLNAAPTTARETYLFFSNLFSNWDKQYSYQDNIRFCVSNIIARVVFGIPHVPIESMIILEKMAKALALCSPDSKEFQNASQNLKKMSDELIEKYGREIYGANKYLSQQVSVFDPLEGLKNINAGASLLAEGNLSNTIMIAIYQINQNQDIKQKLREELQGIDLQEENIFLRLQKLPYLQQIYTEALRFVQPAVLTPRKLTKPSEWTIKDKQGNLNLFTANAGSYFFAPLRAMAHDKRWKSPEQFLPERFENCKNEFREGGSFPFSLGQRKCPAANQFTRVVFKLALALVFTQVEEFILDGSMDPIAADALYTGMAPELFLEEVKFYGDYSRTVGVGWAVKAQLFC